jgi:hypothetical protein
MLATRLLLVGTLTLASIGLASCAAPAKPAEPPASPPPPQELDPAPAPVAAVVEPESAPSLPDHCAEENADGICAPPGTFVHDICNGFAKPDVALALFAKDSPWTRAYLRMNVDAWYAASRSARVTLKLDEEVIVLRHPEAKGGIIVNSGAPFDVIRLDGNCATLSGEEVTLKRPPAPKHPVVPWRLLDPRMRETLLSDPAVAEASGNYESGCVEASPVCTKAGSKLTSAILAFLAHGGKLPVLASRR